MTLHSWRTSGPRLLSRVILALVPLLLALAMPCATAAGDAKLVTFDLPPDLAEVSLKRFSSQASREVLFAASVTDGIRTNAVKGRMTPGEALRAMLAKTGLIAVADATTGAFSVRKEDSAESKNGEGAISTRPAPKGE